MQVIRLRAVNNTHRENLIQYKNLQNKIWHGVKVGRGPRDRGPRDPDIRDLP